MGKLWRRKRDLSGMEKYTVGWMSSTVLLKSAARLFVALHVSVCWILWRISGCITGNSLLDWWLGHFDLIWCRRKNLDSSKKDICDGLMLILSQHAHWYERLNIYLSDPVLILHTDTSDVHKQINKHRDTLWPAFSCQTAASMSHCGEPDAAFAEHMMTGIPSCSGLDVIPNTGLRNASENNTLLAKWMTGCLTASHSKQP